MMKFACIGAGVVGGTTFTFMSEKCQHMEFWVYDNDKDKITKWKEEKLWFYETGLTEILGRANGKNLFFTNDFDQCLVDCKAIFISVNTPNQEETGALDVSNLESVAKSIGDYYSDKLIEDEVIVIEKSTVSVRTGEKILKILQSTQNAVKDLQDADRVIIGGNKDERSRKAIDLLKSVYLNWMAAERIITTDLFSSELAKLVSNCFLAQRICSINSISAVCEKVGADIDQVSHAVGSDSRIGHKYLRASSGFGGKCLKKDLNGLIYLCQSLDLAEEAEYWRAVLKFNEHQKKRFSHIIIDTIINSSKNRIVTLLGVSFKENSKEITESPAAHLAKDLIEFGFKVNFYDSKAEYKDFLKEIERLSKIKIDEKKLVLYPSALSASEDSSALVFTAEWTEFKDLEFKQFFEKMSKPAFIFDAKRMLNDDKCREIGFNVFAIGKKAFI